MNIGFDQIKEMKIKDIIQLKADKERLEKENTYLKAKYPMAKLDLEKDDSDINKFLEELGE